MPVKVRPLPFIRHRSRSASGAESPSAPVLIAASFADGTLSLTFDREMDFSAIVPGGLVVLDSSVPVEWGGTAEITPGEFGFSMIMIENGEYVGSGLWLEVPTGAGIKSSEGVAWDGAVDVELPFSS
jgi:hypothetical protein